jgi:Caenorhabditis protein of unknown function, DUF268
MSPFSPALPLLKFLSINPIKTARAVRAFIPFFRDYQKWQALSGQLEFPLARFRPCLYDRWAEAGHARGGYFHQDLLVARRIFELKPRRHIDIGSRIDGFVAHVAAFRAIEVLDIRPLTTTAQNIAFKQCNLIEPLPPEFVSYSDSVSCLHALEHFGLGRYGDPVDPQGHKKALANLVRMVEPGGWLCVSVPIGPQRVEFNAHRVFDPGYLLTLAGPEVTLERFSYIDDRGELHEDCRAANLASKGSFGCRYGVGIFEFRKRRQAG